MSRPDLTSLREHVRELTDVMAEPSMKAVPPVWWGLTMGQIADERRPITELPTPAMTLSRTAMDHNLAVFRDWCTAHEVSAAPHGKTTMAPALWLDQLNNGAWAITVANEAQVRVAHTVGVPRVVLANLMLRPAGLAWLAEVLDADPGFEFWCWVDSVEAVDQMQRALTAAGGTRPVQVCVELGSKGVRTGARSDDEAREIVRAVIDADRLALAGTSCYEGVVTHGIGDDDRDQVDAFLKRAADLHSELGLSYETDIPILSAGGSIWFDRVAEIFGPAAGRARVVVRAGAYIVHDDGNYLRGTPHVRAGDGPDLRPAMHVWARALSVPDPDVAYLDAGKRDVPYDSGLPVGQAVLRPSRLIELTDHAVVDTNDQHAHLRLPAGSPVQVGDVVRLGLSHPCTAFDKWQWIPVVTDADDPDATVIDFVRTYF